MKMFKKVGGFYSLRSKIVHGDKYKADKLDENEESFVDIVRIILRRILFDNDLHGVFFKSTKNDFEAFLKRLSLGAYTPAQ